MKKIFFCLALSAAILFAGCDVTEPIYDANYSITLSDNGNGTAAATVTGAGAAKAVEGATVSISATPTGDYRFKQWVVVSGNLTLSNHTDNPATFAMPAMPVEIRAEFEAISRTITVNDDGKGTMTADPADATQGATVTITATPAENYRFKQWVVVRGNVTLSSLTDNPATFVMPAEAVEIVAEFEAILLDVVLNKAATTITVGNVEQLSPVFYPSDAANQHVTWSSDDPLIAAVDSAGTVTAVNVGTATITVTAQDGGHTDDCIVTVSAINTAFTITVSGGPYTYNGMPHEPSGADVGVEDDMGNLLTEGVDYTLSHSDNTDAGTASLTATGAGNYAGNSGTENFTINPIVATLAVTVSSGTYVYKGTAYEPSGADVGVEDDMGNLLTEGVDYTLSYSNNTNAGTASLTANGAGNYAGSAGTDNFTISQKNLSISGFNITKYYNGNATVTGFGTLSFSGLENGETATVSTAGVTATYNNADVGTGKPITLSGSFSMTGGTANAANYSITQPTGITGAIIPFAGSGTSATDPYLIGNPAQLALLAQYVNAGNTAYRSSYYRLTDNINLNIAPYNTGVGWIPIGHTSGSASGFHGHFDGDGHTVSNLYINNPYINAANPGYSATGLFGYVINGGSVANLGVEIAAAGVTGGDVTGGIVGFIESLLGDGYLRNCYVTGAVSGRNQVGGVAGWASRCTITNCYSTGTVSGNNEVGGVAGRAWQNASIINCYATGAVSGGNNVGGVTGLVGSTGLTNCYSTGAVSGNGRIGGIAGSIEQLGAPGLGIISYLTNCYATGAVSGNEFVGGVAGTITSTNGSLTNCAALNPSVNRTSGSTGTSFGRVAGYASYSVTLSGNVAWSSMSTNSGVNFLDGLNIHGTGITAAQARMQSTYTTGQTWSLGWQFGTSDAAPWKMGVSGTSYVLPVFYWQNTTPSAMPGHL